MEKSDYIDAIKLQLFGDVLESEIEDKTYEKIMDMALTELNRYYSMTEVLELPATSCIDLSKYPQIKHIVQIFRTEGVGGVSDSSSRDPVAVSQLQMYNSGSTYYSNEWIYNYMNYALNQQLRNTLSTDLEYREDKEANKLYVNFSNGTPQRITIEYVPKLRDCSEVKGEYWEDILQRLAIAHTKVTLGRIRTRYTQEGAQWTGDGDTILGEGTAELNDLRAQLRKNQNYILPLD